MRNQMISWGAALVGLCGCLSHEAFSAESTFSDADSPRKGLVAHWKLAGDCRDDSGHGNHGVNHGVNGEPDIPYFTPSPRDAISTAPLSQG